MDPLAFTRFAPRHDGWSPQRQLEFIVALARGATPGEAAAALGMPRQTAYALPGRPGAGDFARVGDESLAFARQVRIARAREAVAAAKAHKADAWAMARVGVASFGCPPRANGAKRWPC
jgi:hypothetical protein